MRDCCALDWKEWSLCLYIWPCLAWRNMWLPIRYRRRRFFSLVLNDESQGLSSSARHLIPKWWYLVSHCFRFPQLDLGCCKDSPGNLLYIGHFLGHIFRSIQLMDKVNKDPVYSGVEDEVEFYLCACYSGDQLQRLLAKTFYCYLFNCDVFGGILYWRTSKHYTKAQMFHCSLLVILLLIDLFHLEVFVLSPSSNVSHIF